MAEKIEINGKKYLKRTIELLSGVKNFHELDDSLLLVAEAIDYPYDFPYVLEDIYDMDFDEDLRLALARIQIDSRLNMCDDLEGQQLRLYVAETVEKMLFGELLLEGNGKGKEPSEDKPKKKSKAKEKGKSKGKEKGKGSGKGKGKSKSKGKGKGKSKEKGKGKGKSKEKGKGSGKGKGKGKGSGKGKKKSQANPKDDWEEIYN